MSSAVRFAKLAVRHPIEAAHRLAGLREDRLGPTERHEAARAYQPEPGWLDSLHERLEVERCQEERPFSEIWREIESAAGELRVESHDGDRAFGRALWCIVRHTGAGKVVESGVARGVSSRIVLEALIDDPDARLWSVDLPLLSDEWADLTATAVPEALRSGWTYVRGPSRRALPKLLSEIAPIDVFVQDSRGTTPTAGFEFRAAWDALAPGGFLLANSIERSLAFDRFAQEVRPAYIFTGALSPKPGIFGLMQKHGT